MQDQADGGGLPVRDRLAGAEELPTAVHPEILT